MLAGADGSKPPARGPSPASVSSELRESCFRWAGILAFSLMPVLLTQSISRLLPRPPSEYALKEKYFSQRPEIDTVVLGGSRAWFISQGHFMEKGWAFFNLALSGISPTDLAIELQYAIRHHKIRRVVMGVPFEDMIELYPGQFSTLRNSPFSSPEALAFVASEGPSQSSNAKPESVVDWISDRIARRLLPIKAASLVFRIWVSSMRGQLPMGEMTPFGNYIYPGLEELIADGGYDLYEKCDPKVYLAQGDRVTGYLGTRQLAPHALKLYAKLFDLLRQRNIACVVFEAPRTSRYQDVIDSDPLLSKLQVEWWDFYRRQSYGGIKFLDAAATRGFFTDDDFIDAIHLRSRKTDRFEQRLADELSALEPARARRESRQDGKSSGDPASAPAMQRALPLHGNE